MYQSRPAASANALSERRKRIHDWQPHPCPQSPSYPETPQPSSPNSQMRPLFLSHPALGPTSTGTVKNGKDCEYGKSLLNGASLLPQPSQTLDHDNTTAPPPLTMIASKMEHHPPPTQSTTTPRQRRNKKMDPLGSSLHSYLQHGEQPTTNTPQAGPRATTISEEANIGGKEQESSSTRRRSVRDRPSNIRSRRSITMPLPPRKTPDARRSLTDHPFPPLPFQHGSLLPDHVNKQSRGRHPYLFHDNDNPRPNVVPCSRRVNACYEYSTHSSQPLGWAFFVFLVSIICSALYFANEHIQLRFVHKQLVQAHEEKTQLLLAANKQQATMYSTKNQLLESTKWTSSTISSGSSAAPIGHHSFHKHHDANTHQQQQQHQVQLLQKTIQDMATRSLQDRFPTLTQTGQSTMIETQVLLEGHASPLYFAIAHDKVPYAAWTWLDQVQRGVWDHAHLTHVGDDDFMEIRIGETSTSATGTTTTTIPASDSSRIGTPSTLLSFQEQGFPVSDKDRFVLGLRNPVGATSSGLILTIHLTQGTCGQVDDEEVCFGKVVGGFDSLRMIRSQKQALSVESIQIQH